MALPNLAAAQDCVPNNQAPYRMMLLQQEAQQYVSPIYKLAWYSTSSVNQVNVAFKEIGYYAFPMPVEMDVTQLHIMIFNEEKSFVLYGDGQVTCGVSEFNVIQTQNAKYAVSAATEVFEYEQAKRQRQNQSNGQRSTQAGDPVFNMSDEDRRAWQLMQGILQGNDPAGGIQDLFKGNGD